MVLTVALHVAEHAVGEERDGPVGRALVDPAHEGALAHLEELGDRAHRAEPAAAGFEGDLERVEAARGGLGQRAGRGAHFFFFSSFEGSEASEESAAMKASCGTSTEPMFFMRFLPSFCFSSSLRLREMSPP